MLGTTQCRVEQIIITCVAPLSLVLDHALHDGAAALPRVAPPVSRYDAHHYVVGGWAPDVVGRGSGNVPAPYLICLNIFRPLDPAVCVRVMHMCCPPCLHPCSLSNKLCPNCLPSCAVNLATWCAPRACVCVCVCRGCERSCSVRAAPAVHHEPTSNASRTRHVGANPSRARDRRGVGFAGCCARGCGLQGIWQNRKAEPGQSERLPRIFHGWQPACHPFRNAAVPTSARCPQPMPPHRSDRRRRKQDRTHSQLRHLWHARGR